LDTNSKCQYDSEVLRQKQCIGDALILVSKKQTPTVKVITVRLKVEGRNGNVGSEGRKRRTKVKAGSEGRK
jgi:hypothetical protein